MREKRASQRAAGPGSLSSMEQQLTELFAHLVEDGNGRILLQIVSKSDALLGAEIPGVATQQGQQPAVACRSGIELAPDGEELLMNQPDPVKAIRDNHGIGKVPADNRTISRRQVHANHPHPATPQPDGGESAGSAALPSRLRSLPFSQPAAVDSVPMSLEALPPECLGRLLPLQNSRKPGTENTVRSPGISTCDTAAGARSAVIPSSRAVPGDGSCP
jgi:hypothetical protein